MVRLYLTTKFNDEENYQHSEIKRGNDRMQALEDLLQKERDDRIESLDSQLNPINSGIEQAFKNLEAERNARVQKEREILELLQEEANKVEDAINTEQEGRLERQADLTEKLGNELKRQKNRIEQIVDSKTVCTDDVVVTTLTGKMGISEDDFIVMTHPVKSF